jgi:V/A-type H+-transporting ATPase subunit E
MEELRSTEILDREIQEDARKKAEKTLAGSQEECKTILAEVDTRIQAARKEKEAAYEAKIAALKRDMEAALPLEKKRYLVSFEGKEVTAAINAYLVSLSQTKRLSLIETLLSRYKAVIGDKKFKALVFGMETKEADAILKNVFPLRALISCEKTAFEKTGVAAVEGIEMREGIILETEDGAIRARATLDEIIDKLLDIYRYELTSTLFGGRLPE